MARIVIEKSAAVTCPTSLVKLFTPENILATEDTVQTEITQPPQNDLVEIVLRDCVRLDSRLKKQLFVFCLISVGSILAGWLFLPATQIALLAIGSTVVSLSCYRSVMEDWRVDLLARIRQGNS